MKKRAITISLFTLALILIIGNPSEDSFLNKLQQDYGQIHQGVALSKTDLQRMGKSSFNSYLFWSSYRYAFGNIEVRYFGVAFMTFYLGSSGQSVEEPETEKLKLS